MNSVTVVGINDLLRQLDGYTKAVNDIDRIMNQELSIAETNIKLQEPVITGFLRNSTGYRRNGLMNYDIYAQANYAVYVESIYARRNQSFFYDNLERRIDIMVDRIKHLI